jgi:hypothetical protein
VAASSGVGGQRSGTGKRARPVEDSTPVLLQRLAAERDRIDTQITDLIRTRDTLDRVIKTAANTGSPDTPAARQSRRPGRRSATTG